jgi:hypothetical protein
VGQQPGSAGAPGSLGAARISGALSVTVSTLRLGTSGILATAPQYPVHPEPHLSARPTAGPRDRRALIAATCLGALVVVAAVGYLTRTDGPSSTSASTSAGALPAAEFPEPGVVHVHGLGVDPATGVLFAATHSGLFEIPETGEARRVANRYQDTMGFTVAGPGVLLGSGHPDPREDDVRPPLLGLIESRDGGRTWQRLSLHGQADFHALQAAHGRVYGYDATSGTFMVSPDRQDWDRRAELPLRDFAVSPTDPDAVLATTERGVVRSADGGSTFALLDGAPTLVVLAWAAPQSLFGIAPDGLVHHSADGGATWTARGRIGGEPEAVAVDTSGGGERLYAAAAGRGIVVSDDGGVTFTVRYRES